MRLLLKSEATTPPHVRTPGQLWIDGVWHCYTLEDLVREPEYSGVDNPRPLPRANEKPESYHARLAAWVQTWKVYGETAIPAGVYEVRMTWSPHFKRTLPEIFGVPGFTDIRMHGADSEKDLLGCVGVGDLPATRPGFGRSGPVLDLLCMNIREAEKAKEKIEVEIQRAALLAFAAAAPIPGGLQ